MLRTLLASIFLIPCLAVSQNEEVPEIPAIIQPEIEPQPAPQLQAPKVLGDTLIQEPIEELKLSGTALADLYRSYTGRRVIVSSAADAAEFKFVQPASPQDPLTYREAAELLKKAATIENFIFVPAGDDPNLDYLTLATAGVKPAGIGLAIYTEKDLLPQGDAVISYIMTLNFLKPDEAVRVFQQVVGQFGAFGSITTSGSTVVITENTSLIRKLIELKDEIDKPSSQVATKFIEVKYADVTELATTLNELLGNQNDTGRTAGVQRAQQNNNPNQPAAGIPADQAGGGSASGEAAPVQIIPDARTNRLFAMGRPVDLIFVEGLVHEFDTESDQRNFLRRKLKFLAVADFLPIAGDALTRAFSGTGTAETTQQAGGGNRQQSNNNNNNNNNQNTGNAGNTSGARGDSLSAPTVNSAPESLLIGRTLLVADNITNSIVVQGPPSGVEIIEKLLDQVDVKADQVMISTVFGQLSLGNTTSTGVDWIRSFGGSDNGGLAGSSIGGGPVNSLDPTGLITPITGTNPGEFANQTGLSLYGKIGNSLGAYVNLLSTSSDFTILSRPSIFTANNQKGTISSGRRIAIPTTTTQNSVGQPTTSIEYRDVVLKLEVIPLVNSENEITLQIALVSDDIIDTTNIVNVGEVPIIGTREILTTVTVPNNQTVVLGGLITTTDTESVTGIPLLSDIPGLGRLFSTKTEGVDRDELMIFIQPTIVKGSNDLDYVQADMDSRYEVSDEARTFADGAILPPLDTFPVAESSKDSAVHVIEQEEDTSRNPKSLRPIHRR
ncbi:MAG: secretin N-terminal domain-containing protein [Luteolibacter sp.]